MFILFVVYSIFAYLIIMGVILGELASEVKPNTWQLAFFIFAPLFLPVYTGNWMFHVMNPDAGRKDQETTQAPVKVEIINP
jgi:hypothetical protein